MGRILSQPTKRYGANVKVSANRPTKNGPEMFILEMGEKNKKDVAAAMAYRGLNFSMSASLAKLAVLFSTNPYSVCDIDGAENVATLAPLKKLIDASRALDGKGTHRVPPGKELWPYQKATLDYLIAHDGGLDADEPGLGKTPTAIVFCNHVEARRVLCIVPASVRIQWGERIAEWSTIPDVSISVMLKVKDGIHPTAHYQVISYEAARNPAIMKAISKTRWDVLICDEAHKMKSADALTTRAILGNREKIFDHGGEKVPAICTYANRSLALTGTPLLNRPSESYVLLRHFDWESIDFMTEDAFKERYNKQANLKTLEGKHFKLESTSLELELQNRLRVNIMARHEKKDVLKQLKLPRFQLVKVVENRAVKGALDAEGMLDIDIRDIQSIKDITVLGHIAEARRLMGEAIAPQVAEYARDFLEGSSEKLVIFAWHISVLRILEESLSDFNPMVIHGGSSPSARERAKFTFINDPACRVIIGNIQSMGEGVDGLQHVASRCFLAEPDWVPSKNDQAVARLWRIGQEGQVTAELFVAPGSVGEKILVAALKKLNIIHRTLDERQK